MPCAFATQRRENRCLASRSQLKQLPDFGPHAPPSVKLSIVQAEAVYEVTSWGQKKEGLLSLPESPGMRVGGKWDRGFEDLGALARLLTEKKPTCHTPPS